MRITDTARQLQVMLHALEADVIPDLQSRNAQVTAGLIKTNLEDLLKREQAAPTLLAAANREGAHLIAAMQSLLDGTELSPSNPPVEVPCFASVRSEHETLTTRIAVLVAALSAARTVANDATTSALLRRAAEWECDIYVRWAAPVSQELGNEKLQDDPLPQAALEAFIQSVHPDRTAAIITEFERLHGGFAKQTFKFSLRDASGNTGEFIARKMDRVPVFSTKAFLIEREFVLLQALHQAGFPVAKPLWVTTTPPKGADANFCITEKSPGSPPGSFLGGASQLPERLLFDLAELLARLHGLSLDTFSDYIDRFEGRQLRTESVETCYKRTVADWRRYTSEVEHLASPVVAYLFDWLDRNAPRDTRPPVLVHADFNIHNVLAVGDQITTVLDWESAMFGAPEQDLAWIKPHVSKHIDWDKFVAHYVASGGRKPDLKSINYYAAFSAMYSLAGVSRSVRNLQSGEVPDIRITMIEQAFAAHLMNYALASTANIS